MTFKNLPKKCKSVKLLLACTWRHKILNSKLTRPTKFLSSPCVGTPKNIYDFSSVSSFAFKIQHLEFSKLPPDTWHQHGVCILSLIYRFSQAQKRSSPFLILFYLFIYHLFLFISLFYLLLFYYKYIYIYIYIYNSLKESEDGQLLTTKKLKKFDKK